MTIRVADGMRSRATENQITGSAFDQRKPPRIPAGIEPDVRKIVARLLENNTHLWDPSQMESLLRLARLYWHAEKMEAEIERDGYTIEHEKKGFIVHPLLSGLNRVHTTIMTHERALGISFAARGANVKKAESKTPGKLAAGGKGNVIRMA